MDWIGERCLDDHLGEQIDDNCFDTSNAASILHLSRTKSLVHGRDFQPHFIEQSLGGTDDPKSSNESLRGDCSLNLFSRSL